MWRFKQLSMNDDDTCRVSWTMRTCTGIALQGSGGVKPVDDEREQACGPGVGVDTPGTGADGTDAMFVGFRNRSKRTLSAFLAQRVQPRLSLIVRAQAGDLWTVQTAAAGAF